MIPSVITDEYLLKIYDSHRSFVELETIVSLAAWIYPGSIESTLRNDEK